MYCNRNYTTLLFAALIFAGCSKNNADASLTVTLSDDLPTGLEFLASQKAFEPQLTMLRDDALVLTWREKARPAPISSHQ